MKIHIKLDSDRRHSKSLYCHRIYISNNQAIMARSRFMDSARVITVGYIGDLGPAWGPWGPGLNVEVQEGAARTGVRE